MRLYSHRSWRLAGMTECQPGEERWTPPVQPLRVMLAGAHLLNGSPPISTSFPFTLTSQLSTPLPACFTLALEQ